jgi:hypothetical protein
MRKGILAACLVCVVVALPAIAARSQTSDRLPPDPRFGAIEAFWMPDAAYEARVGWERLLFDWSQLQPEGPDDWDGFNVRLEWLTNARNAGREVIGIIKNTPAWATDGSLHSGVPRGLYLPVDDPNNLWAVFVRRVVETYGPHGIHRWVIWNEPDIDAETYGHEFEGTVEDYYQLVKVAYQAVHQVDPAAKIHLAGLTYWHDVGNNRPLYIGRFLDVAKADPEAAENDYFFDVVTLHIYFQTDTVFTIVRETQQLMFMRGVYKPIWLNETNASPNLDPAWPIERAQYQITLEQQAAYIVQATALALAAGAERVGIYKFADGYLVDGAESFGLIRADGSRRPGYDALRTITTYFDGAYDASLHLGRRARVVTLLLPGDRTAYVLWAQTDVPVTALIADTAGEAMLVDAVGNVKALEPGADGYTLALEGAACNEVDGCPIGGPPLILIQAGAPAPVTFTAEDIPAETLDTGHSPTATPPAAPSLTATPSASPAPTRTPRPSLTPAS